MPQSFEKAEQPQLLQGLIQIAERPILQTPKNLGHNNAKTYFARKISETCRSCRSYNQAHSKIIFDKNSTRSCKSEFLIENMQVPGLNLKKLEYKARKPAYADPNYRPPPKPVESSTQLYPREEEALDIDL